jgi:hypothetical protein
LWIYRRNWFELDLSTLLVPIGSSYIDVIFQLLLPNDGQFKLHTTQTGGNLLFVLLYILNSLSQFSHEGFLVFSCEEIAEVLVILSLGKDLRFYI